MRVERMITAVDVHAGGEPGRVVTAGLPPIPGDSMFAKMEHLRDHQDWLRKLMLREPRGYPALCCNVILPPTDERAQAGFVIMEQVEYPPMSGSNTICVATALIETGMVPVSEPLTELVLETPAGLIEVAAGVRDGKCEHVTFRNVAAYAAHLEQQIEVPDLGTITVDVAWGGMFYVIAEAAQFGFELTPAEGADITRVTSMLKAAAREQLPVVHPQNAAIRDITIGQLYGPARSPGATRRNAVTVSSGEFDWDRPATWTGVLDRSPCGTGTCAAMAVLHAKGELAIGEDFVHESIVGSLFTGRLVEEAMLGDQAAVVPTITGSGWITGIAQYVVDPTDPFPEGFTVGDLWA
ncbi:MAG TPA: proline racemase family protein [Gaiellales bacterium]|jgi:proline racemase|nr:proline racemase family protein [Gaiellales bacterium]